MRDFKKKNSRITGTILFFLILAVLLSVLSYGFEQACLKNDLIVPLRNKAVYRIKREAEDTVDIVMLGDSLSFSGFTPMVLWGEYGYTGFVCGQPGQKIWEAEDLLRIVLKTQSPKVVILETNGLFNGQTGRFNWRDTIDPWVNYCTNRMPVFRTHDIWKSFVIGKEYAEDHFKGYAFRVAVEPYEGGDYMQKTDVREPLAKASYLHIKHIMDLCRENGAALILVSMPSPVNYSYARHNAVSDFAEEFSIPYIDMNLAADGIGIDWDTDSLDHGEHVNLSGAEKVTKYLGEYLSGAYDLTDHRDDSAFKAWEEEYDRYADISESQMKRIRGK